MVRTVVLAILVLLSPALLAVDSNNPPVFPKASGSNLEKRKFELPRDFEGESNLVIIAFEREQQHDVDAWVTAGRGIERTDPAFRYYELAALSRSNPLLRWWLDSAMRSGISDRSVRERTITLYLDKRSFKEKLHISGEGTIRALLVRKDGIVVWQSEGVVTEAKLEALRLAIKAIQPAR